MKTGRETRAVKIDPIPANLTPPAEILEISELLAVDPGFYFFLRQGFERGYSRNEAWDLSLLPEHQRNAAAFAASIFKRGVLTNETKQQTFIENYEILRTKIGEDGRYFKSHLLLADANLEPAWDQKLNSLSQPHYFKTSEERKNFQMVVEILKVWNQRRRPRHWLVVGGGLISDVALFAASLCHAHVVVMPTTILSAVDAAIGAKCGINFEDYGKNQIGRFYPPECVLIDSDFWKTLPDREVKSGLGELAKHAFLSGQVSWCDYMFDEKQRFTRLDEILFDVIDIKVQIVQEDPFEKSRRRLLNYGHTFGHALEYLSNLTAAPIAHGSAVAAGMVFANFIAKRQGLMTDRHADLIYRHLSDLKILPTQEQIQFLERISDEKILDAIHHDKKQVSYNREDSQWVLLHGPGEFVNEQSGYLSSVRDSTVIACLQDWKELLCK